MVVTSKEYEMARERYRDFARIADEENRKRAMLADARFGRTTNRTTLMMGVEQIIRSLTRTVRAKLLMGSGQPPRYYVQ